MGINLTNLYIDETFPKLVQTSGSVFTDGTGSLLAEVDITASNSVSSSYAVSATSSSYSVTSSYALDNYTAATNTFSDITLTKGDGTTTILDTTPNQMVEKIINRNGFMPKGTPVYVSGSTGDQLNVYGADAGDPNKMPAVFILAQDLDPDEEGLGILSGEITQVDTSAFEDGDEIWVAVGGGYTNQRPTGSNTLVQKLGAVVKAQANGSGVIFGAGRANDVPNIQEGYAWVGDADGVAQPIPTSSFGGGGTGDGFPYTGSALITGSLGVTGSFTVESNAVPGNRMNFEFLDIPGLSQAGVGFIADATQFQSTGNMVFNTQLGGATDKSLSFQTKTLTFETEDDGAVTFDAGGEINIGTRGFGNISLNPNRNFEVNTAGFRNADFNVGNFNVNAESSVTVNTSGSIDIEADNNINLSPEGQTQVNGTLYNNIFNTGSQTFQIDAVGVGGLLMGVGGYVGGLGDWETTANMTFYGADQAFFSAENDFYIKNIYNDTGSITVWSENALTLRGDTSVEIYGGDPFIGGEPQEQINITGKAFATSIASNINGFSTTINQDTTVRQNIRAFVETPMQVNVNKTVTVEFGATLKVINEL